MDQERQHEAHGEVVTLTQEEAEQTHDFLEELDLDEDENPALPEVLASLKALADGEDEPVFTAEQAKVSADLIRSNGGEADHDDLLTKLDNVAQQNS